MKTNIFYLLNLLILVVDVENLDGHLELLKQNRRTTFGPHPPMNPDLPKVFHQINKRRKRRILRSYTEHNIRIHLDFSSKVDLWQKSHIP